VTFPSVFEGLLGASDAEFASDLAGGFVDNNLRATVAFVGADSTFFVLTDAGSVHEIQ